jgi:hypothetical protein
MGDWKWGRNGVRAVLRPRLAGSPRDVELSRRSQRRVYTKVRGQPYFGIRVLLRFGERDGSPDRRDDRF